MFHALKHHRYQRGLIHCKATIKCIKAQDSPQDLDLWTADTDTAKHACCRGSTRRYPWCARRNVANTRHRRRQTEVPYERVNYTVKKRPTTQSISIPHQHTSVDVDLLPSLHPAVSQGRQEILWTALQSGAITYATRPSSLESRRAETEREEQKQNSMADRKTRASKGTTGRVSKKDYILLLSINVSNK